MNKFLLMGIFLGFLTGLSFAGECLTLRAVTLKENNQYIATSEKYKLAGKEEFTIVMELPGDAGISDLKEIKTAVFVGLITRADNRWWYDADIHWYRVPDQATAPNVVVGEHNIQQADGIWKVAIRFKNITKNNILYVKMQAVYPARSQYQCREINTYTLKRIPAAKEMSLSKGSPFIGLSPNQLDACSVYVKQRNPDVKEKWLYNPTNKVQKIVVRETRRDGGKTGSWDYTKKIGFTLQPKSQKYLGCVFRQKQRGPRSLFYEWKLIDRAGD